MISPSRPFTLRTVRQVSINDEILLNGLGKFCSTLTLAQHFDSPEGLSWRRLHMSRAKLKATSHNSELFAGFTMISVVELQINDPTNVPEWLFIAFAVSATILVSFHILALMISTYMLPNIDAVSKLKKFNLVHESPHDRMKIFTELAWGFSTILGLLLFLIHVAILCWVKFWDYSFNASIAASVVVTPVIILLLAFAGHFYHALVIIKSNITSESMAELKIMKNNLDLV